MSVFENKDFTSASSGTLVYWVSLKQGEDVRKGTVMVLDDGQGSRCWRMQSGKSVAVAIEFKTFFMDEWTGAPDWSRIDAIREALAGTVPGILEEQ